MEKSMLYWNGWIVDNMMPENITALLLYSLLVLMVDFLLLTMRATTTV
jgi:hypothetical protein